MRKPRCYSVKAVVIIVGFLFIFFLGMEASAPARVGGGRSSGSRGYSAGGSFQRSAPGRQQAMPQRAPLQPPTQQPSIGKTFLSGLGGGLVGGMLGSILFGGSSHAGGWGGSGRGGFGFGSFILLLIVCGVIYFVYKRYKARKHY